MPIHDLARRLLELTDRMSEAELARFLASPGVTMTYEPLSEEDDPKPTSVQDLIDSARRHGLESEPDMEDGDLEAFVEAAQDVLGA